MNTNNISLLLERVRYYPSKVIGFNFYHQMEKLFRFTIDRKNECICFENGYWLPLYHFKHQYYGADISDGLFHLSKKSWISESLFIEITNFCKKEFPDIDFDKTVKYIQEYRNYINSLKSITNG